MGRKVDVDELVGAADIADRLGWSHVQTVHTTRRRHPDFPQPTTVINGTHLVWYWPDVERWARSTGRYPPKSDD